MFAEWDLDEWTVSKGCSEGNCFKEQFCRIYNRRHQPQVAPIKFHLTRFTKAIDYEEERKVHTPPETIIKPHLRQLQLNIFRSWVHNESGESQHRIFWRIRSKNPHGIGRIKTRHNWNRKPEKCRMGTRMEQSFFGSSHWSDSRGRGWEVSFGRMTFRKSGFRSGESTGMCSRIWADITVQSVQKWRGKIAESQTIRRIVHWMVFLEEECSSK